LGLVVVDGNKIKLKELAHKLVHTQFQEPFQFRIEVTNKPTDFDLFVKDITYGPIEIQTEEEKAGGVLAFNYPVGVGAVSVSMTVRDHPDRRIMKWCAEQYGKVINSNGTVNLPADYLIEFTRYSILDHGESEEETDKWEVLFTQVGDVTESREAEGFLTFTLSMIQFSNLGLSFRS